MKEDRRTLTGAELERRRQALGWSRRRLADEAGVCQETIWRWEKGRKTADGSHVEVRRLPGLARLLEAALAKGEREGSKTP